MWLNSLVSLLLQNTDYESQSNQVFYFITPDLLTIFAFSDFLSENSAIAILFSLDEALFKKHCFTDYVRQNKGKITKYMLRCSDFLLDI